VPPKDADYAPWIALRDKSGTLYIASGAWRDREGKEVEPPPVLAQGRPTGGAVVNAEGDTIEPAPIVRDEGKKDAGVEVPIVEAGANPPKPEEPTAPDAAPANDSGTEDAS
jgi:hypothetical protein